LAHVTTQPPSSGPPFTYEEFSAWFDENAVRFERARSNSVEALKDHLDEELSGPQRVRVRVSRGRVKSKERAWRKLTERYADRVGSLDAIPTVMDDLVGLRIVCTNLSDLERVVEILKSLDDYEGEGAPVLATLSDTASNYIETPKPSGYRAYHVNLCTAVSRGTERHPVTCELQVRTLLQDSWGELTHEDTYKPGGEVTPLVSSLSRRMADLMNTLDDIAEDLRAELDRLQNQGLEEPASADRGRPDRSEASLEAAVTHLAERVSTLEGPIPLAALAWELQERFGQDITDGWFGQGSFKSLLLYAVPGVRISSEGPSYVLQPDFSVQTYTLSSGDDTVPAGVALLHEADRSFPRVKSDRWPPVYAALAEANRTVDWEPPANISLVNELTRIARDETGAGRAQKLTRSPLNYVALGLLQAGRLVPNMDGEDIEGEFVRWTLRRAHAMDLPKNELSNLESWLRGGEARWPQPSRGPRPPT
jgi:ppGpp synthetase/RelA/SpoT-type nucleotidyltranferase